MVLFWLVSSFVLFGIALGESVFAKWGISLPFQFLSFWGVNLDFNILRIEPKIYVSELYLLFCVLIVFLLRGKTFFRELFKSRDLIILFVGILLLVGMLGILWEIRKNPVLVIRNSFFIWYMILPIVVSLLPCEAEELEDFAKLFSFSIFFISLFKAAQQTLNLDFASFWLSAPLGAGSILLIALSAKSRIFRWGAIALLGVCVGVDFQYKIQKTILLSLMCSLLFLWKKLPRSAKTALPLALCFLFFFGLGVESQNFAARFPMASQEAKERLSVVSSSNLLNDGIMKSPWIKGDVNEFGVELFRWNMWKDAIAKFRGAPLTGIGYVDQVVTRYYIAGVKVFEPNVVNYRQIPPIAGPHNSYINALARVGIAGILLTFIHLLCLFVLSINGYYYSLMIFLGGVVYSCFNVGLEGPGRSLILMFFMGVALKLSRKMDVLNISVLWRKFFR